MTLPFFILIYTNGIKKDNTIILVVGLKERNAVL